MTTKIRHRFTNTVLFKHRSDSVREAVEAAVAAGVCLDGALLDGAVLANAALTGISLNHSSLSGAVLNDAVLDWGSLNHAVLAGASLNNTSLDGASLESAVLDGAVLNGASLNLTSFDGASVYGASFYRTAICGAHGLPNPLIQITGSNGFIVAGVGNDSIRIGCQTHLTAHWLEYYDSIGILHGWTRARIAEFREHIRYVDAMQKAVRATKGEAE